MSDDDIDLSPVIPVFRARQLDAVIQIWLDACRQRLGKPRKKHNKEILYSYTVDGYEDDIAHFRRWWALVGPSQDWELREGHFADFNRWLTTDTSLQYGTRKDVLRRVSSMFRWAFRYRYIKTMDYSIWVPKEPEGSASLRRLASLSVLPDIMRAAKTVRDKAIIAILVDTGMRRAECAKLDIKSIEAYPDGGGTILIEHAKKVRGKEITQRLVVFGPIAGGYIKAWLSELAGMGYTDGPLFPSVVYPDRSINPNALYRAVKRAISDAGHADIVKGPHDIRRIYITENRRRQRDGAYDLSLRKQTGHASATVTDLYDKQDVDDIRRNTLSPFAILLSEGYSLE